MSRSVIWGASSGGEMTLRRLVNAGQKVDGFVDSTPSRQGCTHCGLPVWGPAELEPEDHVTIGTIWAGEVARELEARGIVDYKVSPLWFSQMDAIPYDVDSLHRLRQVRAMLADEESKQVYTRATHAWLTGDCWGLRESWYPQYDHLRVMVERGDRVLDGGAFDGSNTQQFLCHMASHVTVVDPFPRERLRRVCEDKRTKLVEGVIAHPSGRVRVTEEASNSHITEDGEAELMAYSLDELGYFDFIKLDIEGAEAGLMEGSTEYLRRHRPKLAVCIYHRMSDLWTIPLAIREAVPEYRMWVGHHSCSWPETVLYARVD